MRVASDAAMERAARLRSGGKSWSELTDTAASREASLRFWRGAKSDKPAKG